MLKWTEIEKDPNLLVNMSTLVFLKKKEKNSVIFDICQCFLFAS